MSGRPRVGRVIVVRVSGWVREARERSGLPVRWVRARLGVAPSSFYRIRAGVRACDVRSGISGSDRHFAYALLSDERMPILVYAQSFPV